MNNYKQVEFEHLSNDQKEIIIALLSEEGYEGFEEEGDLLKSFIPFPKFNEENLRAIAKQQQVTFSISGIADRNWNKEWESNFDPVIIDEFAGIRADFHAPVKNVKHEIIITPKMSFGTGHHATTLMMIKMMSGINFTGKRVLDFGTGTGILAILAEKSGAEEIIAIDNDERSIENAEENLQRNQCKKIHLIKAGSAKMDGQFDIILANIIKNIVLTNFPDFSKQLVPNGILLLSGLLKDDEKEILQAATINKMSKKRKIEEQNWICLEMSMK
jgi:ribosomal protein L11 methyltransferase